MRTKGKGCETCFCGLDLGEPVVDDQLAEDFSLTLLGEDWVGHGIVGRRSLEKAGK